MKNSSQFQKTTAVALSLFVVLSQTPVFAANQDIGQQILDHIATTDATASTGTTVVDTSRQSIGDRSEAGPLSPPAVTTPPIVVILSDPIHPRLAGDEAKLVQSMFENAVFKQEIHPPCAINVACQTTLYYDANGNVVGSRLVNFGNHQIQYASADGSKVYDFGKLTGMDGQGITGVTYNLPGHDPIHIDFDYTGTTSQLDLKALDTAVSDLVAKGLAQPQFTLKNFKVSKVVCVLTPCGNSIGITFQLDSPITILKYDMLKTYDILKDRTLKTRYEIKSVAVQDGPVQTFINSLRDLLKDTGLNVRFSWNAEKGVYDISIMRLQPYVSGMIIAPGVLLNMSFSVDKNGNVDPKSITANYANVGKVDGNLLFQAMSACPSGDICPVYEMMMAESSASLLAKMAKVVVDHVDAKGAIFFQKPPFPNDTMYKTYRDSNGQVIVERVVPTAVLNFVTNLKNLLQGSGLTVRLSWNAEKGVYDISITRPLIYVSGSTIAAGVLLNMSFSVDKNGNVDPKSIAANYAGVAKVDGNLLFQAMGACPSGDRCSMIAVTNAGLLAKMAAVIVDHVDEGGVIYYTLNNEKFKVYRDSAGQVVVKRDDPIHNFLDTLQGLLGNGFNVSLGFQKDGSYQITVTDLKISIVAQTSGLQSMLFWVSKDGVVDTTKPIATNYYGPKGVTIAVDGNVLFEAARQLMRPIVYDPPVGFFAPDMDQRVIQAMTQLVVTQVSPTKTIYFKQAGINYIAWRRADSAGTVIVLPVPVAIFMNQLRALVNANGYQVFASSINGVFTLTVKDMKAYFTAPTSGLQSISFEMNADGSVNASRPMVANYYSSNARTLAVDGNLLFQGMKACPQGQDCSLVAVSDKDALNRMTSINVTSVKESGAIHFDDKNGNHFKVFRDKTGQVILEQEFVVILS